MCGCRCTCGTAVNERTRSVAAAAAVGRDDGGPRAQALRPPRAGLERGVAVPVRPARRHPQPVSDDAERPRAARLAAFPSRRPVHVGHVPGHHGHPARRRAGSAAVAAGAPVAPGVHRRRGLPPVARQRRRPVPGQHQRRAVAVGRGRGEHDDGRAEARGPGQDRATRDRRRRRRRRRRQQRRRRPKGNRHRL